MADLTMADLISRAEMLEALGHFNDYVNGDPHFMNGIETAKEITENLPAVDAVEVVHARWVKMMGMMPPEYHGHYECSQCRWHMKGLRNSWTREEELLYCPGCGAKMDGERREE